MVQLGYLASTLLMGLFLVAVVAFLRVGERREYTPTLGRGEVGLAARLREATRSPTAWIVAFLAASFAAGLTAVVYVGGLVPAEAGVAAAGPVLAAVVALLVGGYLLWGAYTTARARGYQNAAAVMVSAWVLGLLFVTAIAAYLLTG